MLIRSTVGCVSVSVRTYYNIQIIENKHGNDFSARYKTDNSLAVMRDTLPPITS